MRVVFMGTPDFARVALARLLDTDHTVVAVYSQPPRPAGRHHAVQPSPVQRLADEQGLSVHTPLTFKDSTTVATFAAHQADVAIVAAYGLILPPAVLMAPRLGCVNIHASLLPRWRGASPIQRAIEAGDAQTGITLMQMDKGLDTGAILQQRAVKIEADTTTPMLHDMLAELGADMMVDVLPRLETLRAEPQDDARATYAAKLTRAEGVLDFSLPAAVLERQVRAYQPWPGSFFHWQGETIKVLAAQVEQTGGAAGVVLDDGLLVGCGGGQSLRLLTVQRAGKSPLGAEEFLRGWAIPRGSVLNAKDVSGAAL